MMTQTTHLLSRIFQISALILFPFLMIGVINRTKAVWAGRKGAPLLQPLYDFVKLLRKGTVTSETASFITGIGPTLSVAALVFSALLLPFGAKRGLISFEGDFFLFAGLIGFSKLMLLLTALDSGSSFEGMGASREINFSIFIEPAFFMILATVSYMSGFKSLNDLLLFFRIDSSWSILIMVLTVIALFIMLLSEGCRVPVDDPNTHLELTMIHEVMILDLSGPDLGIVLYGAGMKMFVIGSLIANFMIPGALAAGISIAIFCVIMLLLSIVIGAIESLIPRVRMSHVPDFMLIMGSLGLLIASVGLISSF